MKKVIFGSACMVSGLLLVLIMLFIKGTSDGGLNLLGKIFIGGGVAATIIGVILCLLNLSDEN